MRAGLFHARSRTDSAGVRPAVRRADGGADGGADGEGEETAAEGGDAREEGVLPSALVSSRQGGSRPDCQG